MELFHLIFPQVAFNSQFLSEKSINCSIYQSVYLSGIPYGMIVIKTKLQILSQSPNTMNFDVSM